jgi:hypothetical protein
MTRREFFRTTSVLPLIGGASLWADTKGVLPRSVNALLDCTISFKPYLSGAFSGIDRVLDALGPGDSCVLQRIAGGFDAARQVSECVLPLVDPELLAPSSNYPEYLRKKAELKRVWEDADRRKAAFREALRRPVALDTANTDVFGALEYASHRIQPFRGQTHLLLFSDLVHDFHGVKTELPPRQNHPFPGTNVTALFVPWQGSLASRQKTQAWDRYFMGSGAKAFSLFDEAQSLSITPISASAVLRVPENPFHKKRG